MLINDEENDIGEGNKELSFSSPLSDNSDQVTFPHPGGHFEKVTTSNCPKYRQSLRVTVGH